MCVKATFLAIQYNKTEEERAPEGRPTLAQRFSAGKTATNDSSPGGTTDSRSGIVRETTAHTLTQAFAKKNKRGFSIQKAALGLPPKSIYPVLAGALRLPFGISLPTK